MRWVCNSGKKPWKSLDQFGNSNLCMKFYGRKQRVGFQKFGCYDLIK